MNCSIIGSFRKYYNEIKNSIHLFEEVGIKVLSPKSSKIIDDVDNFVILQTDKSKDPVEIQLKTLFQILNSDFVYVYNPNGYVGKTTCYEIGKIEQKKIPIYYLEKTKDLPILVVDSNIISPIELSSFFRNNNTIPNCDNSKVSNRILKLYNQLIEFS